MIAPQPSGEELQKATLSWNVMKANDGPGRQDFISRFENDTAFYFHQQYTAKEKNRKRELKQLEIPIDRVRPIIRRIVAKIVKNRPMVAALAEDFSNAEQLTRMVNAQTQYTMRICKGLSHIRRALMNTIRGGLGYLHVYIDYASAGGTKEVKFKYQTPKKVFVDFKAQDPLFDDARQVQVLEKVMISDAIKLFEDDPTTQAKIIASQNTSYQNEEIVDDSNDQGGVLVGSAIEKNIDEFDNLEHEVAKISGWIELLTTYRKKLRPVFSYTAKADNGESYRTVISKEDAKDLKKQGMSVDVTYAPYIHEEISTETYILREQDLYWIDEYPITPMVWEDTENPYPVSETFFIRGHQKLQNKYYEVVVHNAQAISFPTVFYEADAFRDKDAALKAMATPAGGVELEEGALRNGKVDVKYAQPLNQAFFTLYEQLKHEQEVQASAPALQSGDPANIPETNKALVNLDSFADRPLAINIDAVEACLERVFKNVLKYQAVTYDEQKLMLIDTNPDNNVTVNEAELAMGQDGQLISTGLRNDISKLDYDVSLVPGSMDPLDRTTEFQYAMTAVQGLGATPEFALKKLPIKGIEEEVKKMDTVRNLQQQVQQYTDVIEQLKELLEQSQKQVDKAEKDAVDIEYESKLKVVLARIEDLERQLNRETRDAKRNNQVMRKHIQQAAKTQNKETAAKES
jgi:hypothetical protein